MYPYKYSEIGAECVMRIAARLRARSCRRNRTTSLRVQRRANDFATRTSTSPASSRQRCANHFRQFDFAIGLGEQQNVGVETATKDHGVSRIARRVQHL